MNTNDQAIDSIETFSENTEVSHEMERMLEDSFRDTGFHFEFAGRWSVTKEWAKICSTVDSGVSYADGYGTCSPEAIMMIVCGCEERYSHDKDGIWSNDTLSRCQPKKIEWYREVWVAHEAKKMAASLDRAELSRYLSELYYEQALDEAMPALSVFAVGEELEAVIELAKRKSGSSSAERRSIYIARGGLLMNSAKEAKEFAEFAGLSKEYLKPQKSYMSVYRKYLGDKKNWLKWS